MNIYFFTFGAEGHVYEGGWIRIIAKSLRDAQAKFTRRFGDEAHNEDGLLRYSFSYLEKEFYSTKMYENGNFGRYEWDVIA